MKNYTHLLILSLLCLSIGLIHSCHKVNLLPQDQPPAPIVVPPITVSYTEEFKDVSQITKEGWLIGEYSQNDTYGSTNWGQGSFGLVGKGDTIWYGFSAYSYTDSPDEYVYSCTPAGDSNLSISSWLLTPVLTVKNGDQISFYTRGDTTASFTDRMQVLLNGSASTYIGKDLNSVGDFKTVLYDINAGQLPGGYPTTWSKYQYTFSGLTGETNIRLAFRHFVINPIKARGVGIDQFKFEVN